MGENRIKPLCLFVIILLLVVSSISIYSWIKIKHEKEVLEAIHNYEWFQKYYTIYPDLYELSHVSTAFNYSITHNVTDEKMESILGECYLRARHVARMFRVLSYQVFSDHAKYQKLGDSFGRLEKFCLMTITRAGIDKRKTIRQNLETLDEISNLIGQLMEYEKPSDAPMELIENLLNMTEKLEYCYNENGGIACEHP